MSEQSPFLPFRLLELVYFIYILYPCFLPSRLLYFLEYLQTFHIKSIKIQSYQRPSSSSTCNCCSIFLLHFLIDKKIIRNFADLHFFVDLKFFTKIKHFQRQLLEILIIHNPSLQGHVRTYKKIQPDQLSHQKN